MKTWKELFRTHILERGLNYYEMGAVDYLEKTEKGYTAVVEGTEDYQVEIELRDERIFDMSCDCPYAEEGHYCKHMAAVLYEIENGKATIVFQTNPFIRINEARKELENVINEIPTEDLKALILELAGSDVSLKNQIMTKYAPITPRQMIRLKKQVSDIAYQYSGRNGFINYYYASDYVDELNALLDYNVPQLIEKGHHMEAFELVNCVFFEIGNRDMDDSDGGTSYVANNCYDYWKQILEHCNEEEKKDLFKWFMEHRENHVIDFMEDFLTDFLIEEFQDEELLREKMRMLDEAISQRDTSNDSGYFYSSHYRMVNNVLERIRIMEKLKYSPKEISEYRNQYRNFSEIRRLEIEEFLQMQDYENAIRVLEESKNIDYDKMGLVTDYSEQLIDIYKKINNQEKYKQELIYYVFECINSDIEYVMKLKEACEEEEWIKYREQYLNSNKSYQIRLELLEKEGLYKRLLYEVQSDEFIYALDRYEKVLKKHFPEDVRDMYIKYIEKGMRKASSRNMYNELIKYLKKIKKYPNGGKMAKDIADTWKREYKRRSAMIDELNRAGF